MDCRGIWDLGSRLRLGSLLSRHNIIYTVEGVNLKSRVRGCISPIDSPQADKKANQDIVDSEGFQKTLDDANVSPVCKRVHYN